MSRQRAQAGVTLVELMVALGIGLFLTLVLTAAYQNGSASFRTGNHIVRMQESGRSVIQALMREARLVGYLGCVNESGLATPPFASVVGYDTTQAYVAAGNAALTPLTAGAFTNAQGPVLVIRHGSQKSLPLTTAMPTAGSSIVAAADAFGWNKTLPRMLISDCVTAEAFTPQDVTATTGATTFTLPAAGALSRPYDPAARVRPIETSTFFLATPKGRSNPSLYQRLGTGAVNLDLRVADNIGAWKLTYATGDGTHDSMVSANGRLASELAAGDWIKVKAIRVAMVLMSRQQVLNEPAPYWFDFASVTPTDRFLRKEMATTIALRNRIVEVH